MVMVSTWISCFFISRELFWGREVFIMEHSRMEAGGGFLKYKSYHFLTALLHRLYQHYWYSKDCSHILCHSVLSGFTALCCLS